MQNSYSPRKGDRAQFKIHCLPAQRYDQRWAVVERSNRKRGTVNIRFPEAHRVTPMFDVPVSKLWFKRGDLRFAVPV